MKVKELGIKGSVIFRRTLALVLAGIICTSLLSAVLYMSITRNTVVSMRGDELTLVARYIAGMIAHEENVSDIRTSSIFSAIKNADTNFVDASVYALDADTRLIVHTRGEEPTWPERPSFWPRPWDEDDRPSEDGDTNSTYTLADDALVVGQTITVPIIADAFETVRNGGEFADTATENHVEYLVVGVPIYDDDWEFDGAVIITKPVVELSDRLEGMNISLVISAIATCLLMIIPAAIINKRITDPLREITNVARGMSAGDFSRRADESSAGEIGELAAAINDFAVKSEKLEQTRRDYVANISHELKTPVASIRAMSETLRDGLINDEEKTMRYYNHILHESRRLSRLVNDLLELSRLQSGTVALKREKIDLLPVLEASAETFEQIAEDSGINFTFDKPEYLPTVYTNPDRIQQVLVILIDNAMKHTPEDGQVTLTVDQEPEFVRITVADSGEGISPEDLPHVFERFYKSDKSHSSGGTGLGLSIAREVLVAMGETISVSSTLGVGTQFNFTVHWSE